MKAEIVTIGDELLTGHTVDSNATYIARRLTEVGLSAIRITSVGDSVDSMEAAFRTALSSADVVITTGGLGPTDDDITKKVIIKLFKRNLVFHEEILEDIRARYARRGIDMPAINQNQALLPQGAILFANKHGSAVGICIDEKNKLFISLPGVPSEMKQIMNDEVIPYLQKLDPDHHLSIVTIRTVGIVESRLAEIITSQITFERNVKLAYLPALQGVALRVMATDENIEAAQKKAESTARKLETACSKYVFGRGDDTLELVVGQLLRDNDKTLAVAESCTAGMLAARITSPPGSSDYFSGGIAAYTNEVKSDLLGVNTELLAEYGAVSRECALVMAHNCRERFEVDYALSITGIAGPDGGTEDKPVGTVWIGLDCAHNSYAHHYLFGQDRDANRLRAVYTAMNLLRKEILDI